MKNGRTLVFAILIIIPLGTGAQSFYSFQKQRSLILTGGIGSASYFGDLKNPGDLLDAKTGFSIGLQYYLYPRISVRSEFTTFFLQGDDKKSDDPARKQRNLSFKSTNFELNAVGVVDLFPMERRFYQRRQFNAYGFLGVGLLYMNPKAELNGTTYTLQPMRTEDKDYARAQFVIPYGIGARVRVNPFLNIGIEGAWRLTFTDYMDDVSTRHPDKTGWDPIRAQLSDRSEGMIYQPGAIRGDNTKNDNYYLLQLRIDYYLPKNFIFGDQQRKLMNVKRKAYYR